jgi:hypothetical protein
VIVIVCGAQAVTVRTVRLTRFTTRVLGATGRALTLALLATVTAGRGVSATCTAPPPSNAPPQAQAESLARAVRTDINDDLSVAPLPPRQDENGWSGHQAQKNLLTATALTAIGRPFVMIG